MNNDSLLYVIARRPASKASSTGDAPIYAEGKSGELDATMNFRFVPIELATDCRLLVKRYHDMHGYSCLPDILWRSEACDFIKRQPELDRIFQKACKRRRARQSNAALLSIAAVILSLELLVRDAAGWGRRFPDEKNEAKRLLGDLMLGRRIWLMQTYV